jgi:hypothetical protein
MMGAIIVSGAFMVGIGQGNGPEVRVVLSTEDESGSPIDLDLQQPEVEIFTGLTAMFGSSSFPCVITDVQSIFSPPAGFVGFTVDLRHPQELGGRLSSLGLGALAVIVDCSAGRGQAVLGPVGAATPQTWWADREPSPER